jgi:conjugative transfer region protein TrbK
MRTLTARGWSSVAAFLVLAAVVIAAACTRPGAANTAANATAAGMASGFGRCRTLGRAAENDPGCRELWREENRHFLGGGRR